MLLKISTTQNQTAFEGKIKEIWLPTEQWLISIGQNHIPGAIKLIPGILSFIDLNWESRNISISKGIALVSPEQVSITVSTLTTSPLKKITELRNTQYLLEIKLQKLKIWGNIESINTLIQQIEKLKADIQLAEKI